MEDKFFFFEKPSTREKVFWIQISDALNERDLICYLISSFYEASLSIQLYFKI